MIRLFSETAQLQHSIQLTSFGGSGTTMLYRFLDRYGIDVPKEGHDWIPWKHQRVPPSDDEVPRGYRALYLFGNPMNAVLSVFRRDYQHWHVKRMDGDIEAWDDSWDLDDFLTQGSDLFRLADHFYEWANADREYPIMLLRFHALWDHLPEMFAFLGLPSSNITDFPEKEERNSDWTEEKPHIRNRLKEMYGELSKEINKSPDIEVI